MTIRGALAGVCAAIALSAGVATTAEAQPSRGLEPIVRPMILSADVFKLDPEAAPMEFLDLRALTRALDGGLTLDNLLDVRFPADLGRWIRGEVEEGAWEPRIGLSLHDLDAIASHGAPPSVALAFFGAFDLGRVDEALRRYGYEGDPESGWQRGEPFRPDLQARDPDMPFNGALGRGSTVFAAPGALIESTDPALAQLTAAGAEAAETVALPPAVSTILGAVDTALPDLSIVQGMFVPGGVTPGDPLAVLGGVEESSAAQSDPYPPSLLTLIAEARGEVGEPPVGLVVQTFPCAVAKDAAATLPARWRELPDPRYETPAAAHFAAEPDVTVHDDGALCGVVFTLASDREAGERPAYLYLADAYFLRALAAFASP